MVNAEILMTQLCMKSMGELRGDYLTRTYATSIKSIDSYIESKLRLYNYIEALFAGRKKSK